MIERLLIVGNPLPFHVGGHLLAAAHTLGIDSQIADIRFANGGRFVQSLSWRLRDRRPAWMKPFEQLVLRQCKFYRPKWILVIGLAPLSRHTLDAVGELGIQRLNFLTDDPWSSAHRRRWFFHALPAYDIIFSPRRANLTDLIAAGCPQVHYLPFGYNPSQHYPEESHNLPELKKLASDIVFIGGADADRVPWIIPLINAKFRIALFGSYWDHYRETRPMARGVADMAMLRHATAAAKLSLILVRRLNRDGHVMRSIETAACKACMLVEDTLEHRSLFGNEGECVAYFDTEVCMLAQARRLLDEDAIRQKYAVAAYRRIVVDGHHTYADRLRSMLEGIEEGTSSGI